MRPCHNYFLSFHIQNKVFHLYPLDMVINFILDPPRSHWISAHT